MDLEIIAFANDFANVGGGYIVIGVEEKNGIAIRPVKGVAEWEIDQIQKEILSYNNSMIPAYFPKVIVEEVDKKFVLVLWITTGVQRPYKASDHVTAYIRYASNSVRANAEQERELINMTNHAPFDIRPNFEALEEDISITLPRAKFYMDEDRCALRVEILIHPDFLEKNKMEKINSDRKAEKSPGDVLSRALKKKTCFMKIKPGLFMMP